jgi:hypothetical protein
MFHSCAISYQGRIDDRFAVWVVVTRGVPGDLGTLDPRCTRGQIQVVHRDQDSSLRRLESIADVRKRAADDDAHGVGQVAIAQFVFDRFFDHPFATAAAVVGGR